VKTNRTTAFTVAGVAALAAIATLVFGTAAPEAEAADHIDAPTASAEPTADITDLLAWMTEDASRVNLVANVMPFAETGATFPTSVQYAFHVASGAGLDGLDDRVDVICQFYDVDRIECWAGDAYVEGDPTDPAGIVSDDGALRVFAGLRDDPFFFEFDGFTATVNTVVAAAPDLAFDDAGCPAVDAETSAALVGQLQSGTDGAPASDTFGGQNVLSLVVQVDADVVAPGGDLLAVWASTHAE